MKKLFTIFIGLLIFAFCGFCNHSYKTIFAEDFMSSCDGGKHPAQWSIERNSFLEESAIRLNNGAIDLLSAGNKYLPIIPSIKNGEVKLSSFVNFSAIRNFKFGLCFRYDAQKQLGQAIMLSKDKSKKGIDVVYGKFYDNKFSAIETKTLPLKNDTFAKAFNISMRFDGNLASVEIGGKKCEFNVEEGVGKVALLREHFYDTLKISSFEISSPDKIEGQEKSFTIPMPNTLTQYPIFCDVKTVDYGDCIKAYLTFRGGVPEYEVGEGNYHAMRIDILTRPFLKILPQGEMKKLTLYNDRIILTPPKLAPKYFYDVLYKKFDWPLTLSTTFIKPETDFNLAIGFDDYRNTVMLNFAQTPSETVFDRVGEVLYSGLGLTEGKIKVNFVSQKDKEVIKRVPKTDKRYDEVVNFLEKNHFFESGEIVKFSVELIGLKNIPSDFKVVLEDAYFRPIKELKFEKKCSFKKIGLNKFQKVVLNIETLEKLEAGVYHLRFSSVDKSVAPISDYCAFEVFSAQKDVPAPPIISGMPFLYNSRTETRGLLTDGFDPWLSEKSDEAHYIACTNFMPTVERKFKVSDTVKALGRTYFMWLGDRNCKKWKISENRDIIKNADFLNICKELSHTSLLWRREYKGRILRGFIDFCKTLNDSKIDIASLEKLYEGGKTVDVDTLGYVAKNYWWRWVEYANKDALKITQDALADLRVENPKVKFAQYGPAHIYTAFLKGHEFIWYLKNKYITPKENAWWQFEDYPAACGYGLEHGMYFFTSCLMAMPDVCVYPEIYTGGGLGGCPDGAVFYAHPPYGIRNIDENAPLRLSRRVYEYALASAYFDGTKFNYWNKYGFQACNFTRPWFEALLTSWKDILENKPKRPVKTIAFISSEGSIFANDLSVGWWSSNRLDVRCYAAECVPLIYEFSRYAGVPAGFLCFDKNILALSENDVDTIVLPPLNGMSAEVKKHIRKLHSKGVNLIASVNVEGLEDIFGVKDTGVKKRITLLKNSDGQAEYSVGEQAEGSYALDGAKVLIDAEIPVLTIKRNASASAVFFNVYPQLVNTDRLHLRPDYGRMGTSELVKKAVVKLIKDMSGKEISSDSGKIIAYKSENNETVVIVSNHDECKEISPTIFVKKSDSISKLLNKKDNFTVLENSDSHLKIRVRLGVGKTELLRFK